MYCGVCGSQVPDGAVHCPNCGSKIAAKVVQQPAATEPISAPNIPMEPIPAPNIPTESIPAPNVTSEPFAAAVTEAEDAAAQAAQEPARKAAEEQAAAQRAAQEAAAKAAAEQAAQEAAARAAAEQAAQEAARKAAEEQAAAQRAAQEAAAKAAAEQAAAQRAAQEAAARAAAEKAAAEAAAQKAAAEAAAQAARQAAAQQAAQQPSPAPQQATPQAQMSPSVPGAPQYQMINGHYVAVPKQLQQIQQQPASVAPTFATPMGAPGTTSTPKKSGGLAGGLAVATIILALLAIAGYAWEYFRALNGGKFVVYHMLAAISMPLYVFLGACIFMKTAKYDYDHASPGMAVSYALVASPLLLDLFANPSSYLRYIPNTVEKWLTRSVPLLLIIGLATIIGCASVMYPKKLNAANYAQKALNAKFLSLVCGLVSIASAASIAYYQFYDYTLKTLIDNFKIISKSDFWWLDYGTALLYALAIITGLLAFAVAGGRYRRSLTK